jgi:LysM repeat protein
MSVFKDDQVVAKVLGKVPPQRKSGLKLAALCLCAVGLLAAATYVIVLRQNTPLASASAQSSANFAPADNVKKHLPPVIEEVTASVIELPAKYSVRIVEPAAEPAGNKTSKPVSAVNIDALFDEAKQLEDNAKGDVPQMEKARALYQQALESGKLQAPQDTHCLVRLTELTGKLVLDPKIACTEPHAVFCKVEPGDVIERIAKKYHVNQGQIKRVNRLGEKLGVRVGQNLKMLPGDVLYKVDRQALTGTLYIDGVFIKRYPVGIGPGLATPQGSFAVENKVINPDWYYDGKKVPHGDPKNILGTRWMGFAGSAAGNNAGLGVHGTAYPESVPGRESKGCVRMHNEDVEELYDYMPQGGKVIIE